jgi:predicted dehydrogenase
MGHMIDLVMWLINKKPLYVNTFGNDIITKNSKFKKKSFIIYIFEFSNNIIVKITANAVGIYKHFHEIKVFEKKKTLVNSYMGAYMFNSKKKKNKLKRLNYEYPDKQNRKKLIHEFIDNIIQGKRKQNISFEEQYNLMKVCFAADKSLNLKKRIKINY